MLDLTGCGRAFPSGYAPPDFESFTHVAQGSWAGFLVAVDLTQKESPT